MKQIYSFKKDKRAIRNIQKATQRTDNYGVVSDYGLFGSKEWWAALEQGEIDVYTIVGEISDVYMSGHNDYPQFDVRSNGEVSSWTREGKDKFYKVGNKVKLEYILAENRFDHSKNPRLLNLWLIEEHGKKK